jgi:hypothetical protein
MDGLAAVLVFGVGPLVVLSFVPGVAPLIAIVGSLSLALGLLAILTGHTAEASSMLMVGASAFVIRALRLRVTRRLW